MEIKELRREQYQAEVSLRELQLTMSAKEERYQVLLPTSTSSPLHSTCSSTSTSTSSSLFQDRIEDLEESVRRLERMSTGEGASQEYLKNVVLNYMLRCSTTLHLLTTTTYTTYTTYTTTTTSTSTTFTISPSTTTTSSDIGSRNHMLKAIAAVLRLTDKEVALVWICLEMFLDLLKKSLGFM